jgi:hypothetical protein
MDYMKRRVYIERKKKRLYQVIQKKKKRYYNLPY